MQVETFFPNTTKCWFGLTNFTLVQNSIFVYNFSVIMPVIIFDIANGTNASSLTWITNTISMYTSIYIQNLASDLLVCNNAIENVYLWSNGMYLSFNGWVDFATSFFQTIITSSISFTNIYTTITNKEAANATDVSVYYDFGRIVKLLLSIQPVSSSSALRASNDMLA